MEDLRSRTKRFALRIIKLYVSLPKSTEAQVSGKQALRSGASVGAHCREGTRARSTAEFASKLGGAQQELEETAYWLELLGDSGIVKATKLADLLTEIDELGKILTTCIKNAKDRE